MRPVPENTTIQTYSESGTWPNRVKALSDKRFWHAFRADLKRKNRNYSVFQAFRVAWGVFAKALQTEKSLRKVLRENSLKPAETVLYSYWLDETALGVALTKQKNEAVKAVSRAHRWDVYEEMHAIPFLPFRIFLGNHLDTISCIALDNVKYLRNKFHEIPTKKISLSYLGTLPLESCKKGQNNPSFHLVSCSAVIKRKRVSLILEGLKLAEKKIHWTHLGDGPEMPDLKKKTEIHSDLPGEIEFKGPLANAAIRHFYESTWTDLFISLSESEGLPVSMMEAQSAGIPILSTDVGGVKEIVKEGETGWLLPADCTPRQVAEKLEEIRRIPAEQMREIRLRCRQHWEDYFSAERNYREFVKRLRGCGKKRTDCASSAQ